MNTRRDPHLSESLHRLLDTLPEKELPERYRLGLRMLRKDNPPLFTSVIFSKASLYTNSFSVLH